MSLWQVMDNMRTVRLYNAQQRELARFQAHLDAEHRRTSRVAFLQGTRCNCPCSSYNMLPDMLQFSVIHRITVAASCN